MATFVAEAAKKSGCQVTPPRDGLGGEPHSVASYAVLHSAAFALPGWGTGVTRQSLRQRRDTTHADPHHQQVRKYESLPISCRRPSRSVQVQALPTCQAEGELCAATPIGRF